jgi:hypothetical protein
MRCNIVVPASIILGLVLLSGSDPTLAQDQATPSPAPAAPSTPGPGTSSVPPEAPSPAPVPPTSSGNAGSAPGQGLRERVQAARQDCLQQGKDQGLRGPALRQQVESCFATKMPDVAKRIACRREATANGIDRAGLRAYVLQCLAKKG